MGTLFGHIAPGSFFILFGMWWTIKYSVMWASRMGGRTTSAAHIVSFRIHPFIKRIPVEALCKTVLALGGVVGELSPVRWTLIEPATGNFYKLESWHHATIYLFFALNGFCDILVAMKAPVAIGLDYATLSLAYAGEGLLFFYHLHGRGSLDVHVHQLLLLAIAPCAAVTGLEAWKSDTLLLPMIRSGLTLLQGTWLWQVGFILYPPYPGHDWDLEKQENIAFATTAFCWHISGILNFMSTVYTVVYRVYQIKGKQRGTDMEMEPLSSHILQNESDSDQDKML